MKIKLETSGIYIVWVKKSTYDRNKNAKILYEGSYLGAKRFFKKNENKLLDKYETVGMIQKKRFEENL